MSHTFEMHTSLYNAQFDLLVCHSVSRLQKHASPSMRPCSNFMLISTENKTFVSLEITEMPYTLLHASR